MELLTKLPIIPLSGGPNVRLYNEKIIELLLNHSFKEVGESLVQWNYFKEIEWWENYLDIDIYCAKQYDYKFPKIRITLQLKEWEYWAKPWSMSSLAKELEENVIELNNAKLEYWQEDEQSMLNGFGVEYFPDNIDFIIKPEVEHVLYLL
ncbi:MAG: hypothetical protein WKG06_21745 [Segetibacter sp.]